MSDILKRILEVKAGEVELALGERPLADVRRDAEGGDRPRDFAGALRARVAAGRAAVIAEVAPAPDDIVLPKTSSGVFNSTNLDYVLRNLGIRIALAFWRESSHW